MIFSPWKRPFSMKIDAGVLAGDGAAGDEQVRHVGLERLPFSSGL